MREFRTYGSVRGAHGNGRPYRDHLVLSFRSEVGGEVRFSPPSWDRGPRLLLTECVFRRKSATGRGGKRSTAGRCSALCSSLQ